MVCSNMLCDTALSLAIMILSVPQATFTAVFLSVFTPSVHFNVRSLDRGMLPNACAPEPRASGSFLISDNSIPIS